MKLLHVDSSILGGASVSRTLSAEVVQKLARTIPGLEIRYRDLTAEPVPHLSGAHLAAAAVDSAQRSSELHRDLTLAADLLDEFLQADIVVIGAPMYNFSISSQLKAWLDRLAVAGKTFRYTEKGPEGLAGGKRLIIASSRGGFYAGTPLEMVDHQESYLKAFFGFLGITDLQFVRAEGIALGTDQRDRSVESAKQEITLLAA